MKYKILLLSLLIIAASPSFAKRLHKAYKLISAEQVNNIIGSNVIAPDPLPKGSFCEYKSANGYAKVSISYTKYKNEDSALALLKRNYAAYLAIVKDGKKVLDEYSLLGKVPDVDSNAYYMTGNGSIAAGANTIRLQFALGKYIITFDTRGLMKTTTVPKLGEIYKAIRKETGM